MSDEQTIYKMGDHSRSSAGNVRTHEPTNVRTESAAHAGIGNIEQLPPMHSALKVGGKKLYELARAGVEVERKPRPITIRRLELEAYNPPALSIFVECSKGTYIRSLAYDLGAKLGTGAYLDAL